MGRTWGRWARREKGPNLRMSFITYSTLGHTLMKLTSDRNEIRDGLSRLQNIVPSGATHMQEGFKKANEQIERVYSKNSSASSLIITLTTGPLLPTTLRETKSEADKARDMGAKVYCLGVKDYKKDQLHDIVERKDQMYGIDEFKSLEKLVISLVENSCMEVMAGDTYFVCLGDQKRKDEIVCRYELGFSKVYDKKPTFMNQEKLICPGHTFDKAGQEVFIDYSLDNGVTFVGEDLKIASKDCHETVEPPAVPTTTTVTIVPTTVRTRRTTTRTTTTPTPTTVRTSRTTTRTTTTPTPTTVRTSRTTTRTTTTPTPTTVRTSRTTTRTTTTRTPTTVRTSRTTTRTTTTTMTTKTTVPTTVTMTTTVTTVVTTTVTTVVTEEETTVPMVVTQSPVPSNPLLYPTLIPSLVVIPLLLVCICCCKRKPCPVQTRVIVSCCGCQEDRIKQMEGKLDTFYDFVQHCSQVPLMWCPPRDTGRCTNFTLMNPHCTQMFCGPKICLQPSQECFPLSSCCSHGQHLPPIRSQSLSRMLPLIPPTARKLCRSTLSLPPP
ncbi:anthrax toxin receptor-like isoform X2 [Eschrichtius robustus]|uniref:anthrax toxin receptor-like isoform X2 n=1 Tax=Eschrichtius robustus TaxID=9764 RepID=UPI0035C05DEC